MMARLRLDLGEDGSSVKWYGGRECVLVCTARQGCSWGARQMRIHLVWSEMDRQDGRRTWADGIRAAIPG